MSDKGENDLHHFQPARRRYNLLYKLGNFYFIYSIVNLTIIVTQMEGGLNNFRKRILGAVEFAHRQCFPICDCDVYITYVGGWKVTMILNFYKISVIRHTVSREKGMTVVGVPVKWCEILLRFLIPILLSFLWKGHHSISYTSIYILYYVFDFIRIQRKFAFR